ncbi:MAG: hypothetical protein ACK4GT_15545 [Pararhodobacter sp.]
MRFLALILTFVAAPVWANACESHFRAGLRAGAPLDARLAAIESTLYHGLGWVNRSTVLERLENRSALTTACQEIDALQAEVLAVQRRLGEAERSFRLAASLCWGVNRARAERNLDALQDSARAAGDLSGYLASLAQRC